MIAFIELQNRVRTFNKLKGADDDALQLIKDAINVAYFEEVKASPTEEFLVFAAGIDLSSTPFILPSDFMALNEARYISGDYNWELANYLAPRPPVPIMGKPRAFKLSQGNTLNPSFIGLLPYDNIVAADDSLEVDYYAAPTTLVNDADVIRSNVIEERVFRRACAFVANWTNNTEKAKVFMAPILSSMSQPKADQ